MGKSTKSRSLIRGLVVFLMLVVSMPSLVLAQVTDDQHFVLNNLQHELSVCVAFYEISRQGFKADELPERADVAERAGKMRDEIFFAAFQIGKLIGMTQAGMTARITLAGESMSEDLAGNWANYSVLLQKHLKPCAALSRNYAARFEAAIE